jgi:hypothetical protein
MAGYSQKSCLLRRKTAAISVRGKSFQHAGRVIAVINDDDLKRLAEKKNANFLDMLRREYEAIKFDVPE